MKVPKFISMSATQVPDEDIVITAMDNEGNIWQGWSRRKQHAYAITYELESTLGEPRESTASQVCYDSVMHWERILLPGEDSSKAMEVDIVTKKHTPPIAYIPAANYGGYRTISVVKKED